MKTEITLTPEELKSIVQTEIENVLQKLISTDGIIAECRPTYNEYSGEHNGYDFIFDYESEYCDSPTLHTSLNSWNNEKNDLTDYVDKLSSDDKTKLMYTSHTFKMNFSSKDI